MSGRSRAVAALIAAALTVLSCAPEGDGEIVVFAAASLSESFRVLAASFETASPRARVVLNLAGSQTLAGQLLEGAPADVFASADRAQMDRVREAGLVESPFVFAKNRLVLLVPKGNPRGVRRLADLAGDGVRVLLAVPGSPIGSYSRALLEREGLAGRVERNIVSYEQDVKGVVGKIALGEADAGIVYATDATPATRDRAEAIEIPEAAGIDIAYYAAVARSAPNGAGAARFAAYLSTGDAARVFASFGFAKP